MHELRLAQDCIVLARLEALATTRTLGHEDVVGLEGRTAARRTGFLCDVRLDFGSKEFQGLQYGAREGLLRHAQPESRVGFQFRWQLFQQHRTDDQLLFGVFSPFILGGAIAFILNVPISKLEKHMFQKPKYQNEKWAGRRRGLAMVIVILLTLVAIVAIILIIVPELSKTIVNLAQQIPEGIEKLSKWLVKSTKKYPEVSEKIQNFTKNSEKAINTALSFLSSKGSSIISGGFDVITGILSSVTSFFISFIFSIYLLGNKDKLALQAKKVVYAILSEERADKLMRIARLSNRTFGNFISGQ